MGLYKKELQDRLIHIRVYAIKSEMQYYNLFTVITEEKCEASKDRWYKKEYVNKKLLRFEQWLTKDEVRAWTEKLMQEGKLYIKYQEKEVVIDFGMLKKRQEVFLGNKLNTTLQEGVWPGYLNQGFYMTEWYAIDRQIKVKGTLLKRYYDIIKEDAQIDLAKITDFLGTMIYLEKSIDYEVDLSFNPDQFKILFRIRKDQRKHAKMIRLVVQEGNEFKRLFLFELSDTNYKIVDLDFSPTALGYEIYEKNSEGDWQIKAQEEHGLIRGIHIDMGIITGKVVISETDEELDIVVKEKPIKLLEQSEQPWLEAESIRIQEKKSERSRDFGNVFITARGTNEHDRIINIIKDKILKNSNEIIYIWDPYLDDSVLKDLIPIALSRPSLQMRLLLSEVDVENPSIKSRCKSIYEKMKSCCNQSQVNNVEIRSWAKKDSRAFHDRYIIIDNEVWNIGASLKDLGNYHTCLYKLEHGMAQEVRTEFMEAWQGNYYKGKMFGFEVYPNYKVIDGGE